MATKRVPDSYVQSLVSYAEQVDDISVLTDWRDELFARMRAGEGKTLLNTSVNGQSFQFWLTMSVEEEFDAVVRAIRIYQNAAGDSPITFPDFSRMGGSNCLPPPPCS